MYNNLTEMNKEERSLLLFLETCAVDHGGLICIQHMNDADIEIAKQWNNNEFISFGRIKSDDINSSGGKTYSYWCLFSQKAFDLAHQERIARADRMWNKRTWKRTIDD